MDENSAWHRSPAVGAATLFLFVGGAMALLYGGINVVFAYSAHKDTTGWGTQGLDRFFVAVATVFLLFGLLQLTAGYLVLRRQERGRRLGLLATAIGVILGMLVLYVTNFDVTPVAAILIYGLGGWTLAINRRLFH